MNQTSPPKLEQDDEHAYTSGRYLTIVLVVAAIVGAIYLAIGGPQRRNNEHMLCIYINDDAVDCFATEMPATIQCDSTGCRLQKPKQ